MSKQLQIWKKGPEMTVAKFATVVKRGEGAKENLFLQPR